MNKIIIYIVLSVCLFSCALTTYNETTIPITLAATHKAIADTTLLALNTEIKLETTSNGVLADINKIVHHNELYYYSDKRQKAVLLFDAAGRFVRKIQNIGRGHGEYANILDITVDKYRQELLLLVYPEAIHHYTLQGDFKNAEKLNKSYTDIVCDSSYYYLRNETFSNAQQSAYSVTVMNKTSKERVEKLKLDNEYAPFCSFGSRMYDCGGKLYFTRFFDNTIYRLANGEVSPEFSLDFGKLSFPETEMKKRFECREIFELSRKHKCVYALSNLIVDKGSMMFSTNLFDLNFHNFSTDEYINVEEIRNVEFDIPFPKILAVYGDCPQLAVIFKSSTLKNIDRLIEQNADVKNRFSKKLIRMAAECDLKDNPILLFYSLK